MEGVLRGRGKERAGGGIAAHFLSECTERRTNPREANHSEQLARGGADGGLFRRELKSGSPWVLALGHAARQSTGRANTQDSVRAVNCCFRILALLLEIKHVTIELSLCEICLRSQIVHCSYRTCCRLRVC